LTKAFKNGIINPVPLKKGEKSGVERIDENEN
jgi:hypothetical protein